jgi:hypothetical protein
MANDQFKPSDFMRARRPELYSDTQFVDDPILNRSQFEFHLDTLTQRKDEIRFEHFCRKLAEKELCPNLLPQTGPTGGGDSKTDAETYPVANSIAERWYVGDPSRAAQERWAFAFSAKKDWRPKVKSDVEKIIVTGRGYSLIYFITNQAISDRNRAALEDELSLQWNVSIRILDRTWIVDKVIQNNRWDVVYQTLDIEMPHFERKQQHGPRDVARLLQLEEIDRQLDNHERYQGSDYQLVEDCLHTALLARGLGLPRTEIDGRFDRAERIARKGQGKRQLFQVIYNRAWTAYWWFDDFDELDRLYEVAESLVLDGEWVWDLEKLVNLWTVNNTSKIVNKKLHDVEIWKEHTAKLRTALLCHALDVIKPTSALWARTQVLLMDLVETVNSRKKLPSVIMNIKAILSEAESHLDYPVEPIIRIIRELGNILIDDEAYDELFEFVAQLQSKRVGNAEQGKLRLERGFQKLQANKIYEAIEQFSKAQNLLIQEEVKGDFVQAVVGTALGYEAAGLLWAARANLIFALDRTFYEFYKDGHIPPQSLPLLRKLVWIELQLGRVPCVLIFVELLNIYRHALELEESARRKLEEEFGLMDTILGILILRTRYLDWSNLDRMAALLEKQGLFMSRGAALFALGYEDAFRTEYKQDDDLNTFFSMWLAQPAAADLPLEAEWHIGRLVTMRTVIVGCEIELIAENRMTSILLGESILAFLESIFSTTIRLGGHYSCRSNLKIELKQSEYAKTPFKHKIVEDDCGETHIVVAHTTISFDQMNANSDYQNAFHDLFICFIEELQIQFSQESLEELFVNHRALDRASLAVQSPIAVTNLLGPNPKYTVNNWIDESLTESLALIRVEPWKKIDVQFGKETIIKRSTPEFSNELSPDEMFGVDALKHRDLRIYSPINMPLWDKAQWSGLGFAIWGGDPPVPELDLMFENFEAGIKIFRGWSKRLGKIDRDEWISLTIITGIDRNYPAHYRVAISVNIDFLSKEGQQAAFVSRMKDMTPSNSTNLDNFINLFKKAGYYRLSLGKMVGRQMVPYSESEFSIEKRKLRIVPAWQIGPNDPASCALGGIDNPLIPPEVSDPPFSSRPRGARVVPISET